MSRRGRVIVQEWISADGFASAPDGEAALFEVLDPVTDARSMTHNERLLDDIDVVLLGRRSYESFSAFWPTADDVPIAARVNAIPKRVASSSLEAAPWGDHAPAVVERDPIAWIGSTDLRVLVWGSLALVAELHRAGLVDELDLFVAPVLLGTGTPVLPVDGPLALEPIGSEDWGGATHVRYGLPRGTTEP